MGNTSAKVKNRYERNHYRRFSLLLRLDQDQDLIEYIEKAQNNYIPLRILIKRALGEYMKENPLD